MRRGSHLVCTTPCDVNLTPEAAPVELTLRARGYADHLLVVELLPGERLEEHVTLKRRAAPTDAGPATPPSSLPALRLDRP